MTAPLTEAEQQVFDLGGRAPDSEEDGRNRAFHVYADPAGRPFCLCRL
ncbi:VOC family protein [Streptomyces sp. T-3]|nr:VOC family protein [Streptomyces sp. T-3]